jgi:hypothetical protein
MARGAAIASGLMRSQLFFVIAGLGPAIHEFFYLKPQTPSWVRGPSPRMTT